jgi:hypothetical protein
MGSRQKTIAPAIVCAMLAAGCSGQASVPSPATPDVAARTHAAPASVSHATGAAFTYSGTLKIAGKNGVDTYAVTERVRSSPGTYAGHPITEYDGVETETGKGKPLQTTFGASVAEIPSKTRNGSDVTLEKFTSRESGGISQTTIYGAGNGVFDQLPEVPQASWSNTAARTESIADSEMGSSAFDAYRSDGSYDEVAVPVEGLQASLRSYANGNATYQWPYQSASQNSILTFSPPDAGVLHIFFADAAAVPPQTIPVNIGVWYPSTPPVLASDSFHNVGTVDIPSACGVPQTYGRTAIEIAERVVRLDIVFGEYETTTRTRFVESPYGLLCLEVHDDLKTYYSYKNSLNLSQRLLDETTTRETLGLRRASIPKGGDVAGAATVPLDVSVVDLRERSKMVREREIFSVLSKTRSKP